MPMPQARQKIEYKRPKRLNAVSISLALALAAVGYVIYALLPAFSLRASVVNEMEEALPRLFKLNLLPHQTSAPGITDLKKNLTEKLRKLGAHNKLEVVFDRGKQRVAIQVRFAKSVVFPGLGKTIELRFSPRSETDAARIEW